LHAHRYQQSILFKKKYFLIFYRGHDAERTCRPIDTNNQLLEAHAFVPILILNLPRIHCGVEVPETLPPNQLPRKKKSKHLFPYLFLISHAVIAVLKYPKHCRQINCREEKNQNTTHHARTHTHTHTHTHTCVYTTTHRTEKQRKHVRALVPCFRRYVHL